ncbi:MAG: hypothetical protein ACYDD1_23005 [Caulobacteraceae bacterium]
MRAKRMERSSGASSNDRAIRSLVNLWSNASTARTLNLIPIWSKHGQTQDYKAAPFFHSPILNRSIIVKHRLRANETDAFSSRRSAVTKVILPIDLHDMKAGGRSFFVGETRYKNIMAELLGDSVAGNDHDQAMLLLLDSLPSLDPFLMRERLKKSGFTPARCYFDITDADTQKMFNFVLAEMTPLMGMSFDSKDKNFAANTAKFANKILANAADADLDPLRRGMGIDTDAFVEGMFCWKGFIYYKWMLNSLLPSIYPVSDEISMIAPIKGASAEDALYIADARARLAKTITLVCQTVAATLKIYDDAYADLTRNGHPQAFREFLLQAPYLFNELGERLGAIQHIVSFWKFRFPQGARTKIDAEELSDILLDFEFSLNLQTKVSAVPRFA